jgi:surface polysaccharide O-acyltransferase-like enzyme
MNQRRYDIDALRSIAMFLLIFYHLGISFTSVAPYIAFVQNKRFNDGIWDLLSVMNSWRIPLVFLISGIALRLAFQRRTKIEMFKERAKILIVPYIFGSVTFGAASLAIAFTYYEGWSDEYLWLWVITIFDGVHLWFLKNIFIYCLILIPFLNLVSNKVEKETIFSKILNMPGGVFAFSIPVILEGHLLNVTAYSEVVNYGRSYQEYANTNHGFLLGFYMVFPRSPFSFPRRSFLGIK